MAAGMRIPYILKQAHISPRMVTELDSVGVCCFDSFSGNSSGPSKGHQRGGAHHDSDVIPIDAAFRPDRSICSMKNGGRIQQLERDILSQR